MQSQQRNVCSKATSLLWTRRSSSVLTSFMISSAHFTFSNFLNTKQVGNESIVFSFGVLIIIDFFCKYHFWETGVEHYQIYFKPHLCILHSLFLVGVRFLEQWARRFRKQDQDSLQQRLVTACRKTNGVNIRHIFSLHCYIPSLWKLMGMFNSSQIRWKLLWGGLICRFAVYLLYVIKISISFPTIILDISHSVTFC